MKYATAILLLACLLVLYLWHESTERSSIYANQRDSLRVEIERIEDERDSLLQSVSLRRDTLETLKTQNDSLQSITDALRRSLRDAQRETDIAIQPDFDYRGTDSSLVAAVDSVLRSRVRAAGRDSLR